MILHLHALDIVRYQQDKESYKMPYLLWEHKHRDETRWEQLTSPPTWREDYDYRRCTDE